MLHYTSLLAMIAVLIAAVGIEPANARKATANIPAGFLMKSVKVGDQAFRYVVFVPPAYDPKTPFPAILALHGAGMCGSDGLKQIAEGLGSAVQLDIAKWQKFIIVFPQKQNSKDNWEDEEQMVMAEFNQTLRELNVDRSRMYLTGLSQGGHGTFAIGSRHSDLFAAAAPVCGWGDKSLVEGLKKTPMWVFHGESDEVINVDRSKEMVEWLKAAGAPVKITLYPGVGHGSWDKAYSDEDIPGFFLQHHK
jgi:predicted peptidase